VSRPGIRGRCRTTIAAVTAAAALAAGVLTAASAGSSGAAGGGTAAVAATAAPGTVHYGKTGWQGYGWYNSSYAWSRFYIPRTTGPAGSAVALWAGIGQGNPGIQQIGVTLTMGAHNYEAISEWYEMWPADAHAFPSHPTYPGDRIEVSVQRSGDRYTLRLWDATRHWTDVAVASDWRHESMSEAVAEAFGPSLPSFGPVAFTTSGYPAYGWSMGLSMWRGRGDAFTLQR
jgi:Peptidase A4 family